MEYKSEAHLQSLCVKWHNHNYLHQADDLILIFNNPPDARMGGILKAMGLKPGASDLLYFTPTLKLCWLECKLEGRYQTKEQKEFEIRVKKYGCDYKVFKNELEFQTIIKTYNNG